MTVKLPNQALELKILTVYFFSVNQESAPFIADVANVQCERRGDWKVIDIPVLRPVFCLVAHIVTWKYSKALYVTRI